MLPPTVTVAWDATVSANAPPTLERGVAPGRQRAAPARGHLHVCPRRQNNVRGRRNRNALRCDRDRVAARFQHDPLSAKNILEHANSRFQRVDAVGQQMDVLFARHDRFSRETVRAGAPILRAATQRRNTRALRPGRSARP
jgi:hypothetical protein